MPSTTAVHVDRALSNISVFFKNPSYAADRLSPPVNVNKESDKYFVYGTEHLRIPPTLRRDKSMTREVTYSISLDSYYCEEYGLHELVSDRERENSDEALRPDIDCTEHITEVLLLDREYRVANLVLDSTNTQWGAYAATHFENLAADWDDKAGADPRGNIYHAKLVVFADARRPANTMFIPTEVAYQLAQLEQVDELRKYTDPGLLTDSGLPPNVWGLTTVECQSTYESQAEGATTVVRDETWGNNLVIAYINPNPVSLKTQTFSLTMQKRPFEVRKWREEKIKCDLIEITHLYDTKLIAPACGFVYTNVMTSAI